MQLAAPRHHDPSILPWFRTLRSSPVREETDELKRTTIEYGGRGERSATHIVIAPMVRNARTQLIFYDMFLHCVQCWM